MSGQVTPETPLSPSPRKTIGPGRLRCETGVDHRAAPQMPSPTADCAGHASDPLHLGTLPVDINRKPALPREMLALALRFGLIRASFGIGIS